MKYSQWIGVLFVLCLIGICYVPWVHLPGFINDISGNDTTGTNWGRPIIFFGIFGAIMLICFLIPKVWAKRTNFFAGAFLVAYAIRTFIVFSLCDMGYCPEKQLGLYLMLVLSILVFVMTMLPTIKIKSEK